MRCLRFYEAVVINLRKLFHKNVRHCHIVEMIGTYYYTKEHNLSIFLTKIKDVRFSQFSTLMTINSDVK